MQVEGSYQFEKLEGRFQEAEFLAERANLRLDGFIDLLVRHQTNPSGKILEIGCGQGIRTKLIAENFPNAEVLGIDRSEELLIQARQKSDLKNLTFQNADLYDLPFDSESFDFIYLRLVMMHLVDPIKAVESFSRVLKKGGRILIEDADRDCMFFEPVPASYKNFWAKVQDGQRRLGGDPNVGRKLAPYLKQAKFTVVQIETQPIVGGPEQIEFLARTLMPSLNTYLEEKDREIGLQAIEDLKTLARDSAATFYHFWFVVSGEKS